MDRPHSFFIHNWTLDGGGWLYNSILYIVINFVLHVIHKVLCDITYRTGPNLDKEHVVLVAQFRDLRPWKSIHMECVVVDVQPICTDSDVNVNEFSVLPSNSQH